MDVGDIDISLLWSLVSGDLEWPICRSYGAWSEHEFGVTDISLLWSLKRMG